MSKSSLYTRSGDSGSTSLVGGERVSKDSARLEAYGTVDELNSWIGMVDATAAPLPDTLSRDLWKTVQSRLFDIGSYLATPPDSSFAAMTANPIASDDIEMLENAIDCIDATLPKLSSFVIPGGTVASCNAHVARTVCRRAERRIVALISVAEIDPAVIRYVNRLSDLLFAVARFNNVNTGKSEIFWTKGC